MYRMKSISLHHHNNSVAPKFCILIIVIRHCLKQNEANVLRAKNMKTRKMTDKRKIWRTFIFRCIPDERKLSSVFVTFVHGRIARLPLHLNHTYFQDFRNRNFLHLFNFCFCLALSRFVFSYSNVIHFS